MKKILILITSGFLLASCAETIALLGPATGVTNGKIVHSSLKSVASYGIKKQTGKTPLGHVLAYAEKKNPGKEKEKCISFIEKTNSEACMIVNKQIDLTQAAIVKKISSSKSLISKKKQVFLEKNFKIENKSDNSINSKKPAKEFVSLLRNKIKEYDARWLDRIEKSNAKYAD